MAGKEVGTDRDAAAQAIGYVKQVQIRQNGKGGHELALVLDMNRLRGDEKEQLRMDVRQQIEELLKAGGIDNPRLSPIKQLGEDKTSGWGVSADIPSESLESARKLWNTLSRTLLEASSESKALG